MYKHYRISPITAPDGTLQCYIRMDPEFIAPVKNTEVAWICPDGSVTSDPLGELVCGKTTYSVNAWELGSLIQRIEKVIRKAGLRKIKNK